MQPVEEPHQSRRTFPGGTEAFRELMLKQVLFFFLTGLLPMEKPSLEQKCESSVREEPLCAGLNPSFHFPPALLRTVGRGIGNEGMSLEKGERHCSYICICFSHIFFKLTVQLVLQLVIQLVFSKLSLFCLQD